MGLVGVWICILYVGRGESGFTIRRRRELRRGGSPILGKPSTIADLLLAGVFIESTSVRTRAGP